MRFESYVILDRCKTPSIINIAYSSFESYVILHRCKTIATKRRKEKRYESYVILDSCKTAQLDDEKLQKGLHNILKDSRERLIVTYQLHFVPNEKSMIITPLLAKIFAQCHCGEFHIYLSRKKINAMTTNLF